MTDFCLDGSFWSVEGNTVEEPRPPTLFLVLDGQDVRNQTITLCEKVCEHEELGVPNKDGSKKMRAP